MLSDSRDDPENPLLKVALKSQVVKIVIQNKLYSGVGLKEKYGGKALVAGASEGIGATSTPGYINSRPAMTSLLSPALLRPEQVAVVCFKRLGKQPSFITGRSNRIASFFMHRLIPLKTAVNIMGDTTRIPLGWYFIHENMIKN